MASPQKTFSVLPTLLLSLAVGAILGVLLLLLFGRHVGNPDTVSAVNSGMAGTTVINKDAGKEAAQPSAEATSTTATSQSGTAAQPEALPLSQTVTNTHFTGTGQEIYVQACQSCHQAGGVGAKGAGIYPPLVNNPKLATAAYPETMVLFGNGGMPGFGHYMDDQQIADVVNYIRTELNKNTDKVTPEDIKKLRPTTPDYTIFGEAAG